MRPTALSLLAGVLLAITTVPTAPADTLPPEAAALIERAGNTEDERERLAALEKLAALPLGEKLGQEAKSLAAFVRRWNIEENLNFFAREMSPKTANAVREYDFKISADSPLRPLAELYRGRMLAWYLIEDSNLRADPKLGPRVSANANYGALVKTLAKCKALTGTTEFDELLAREEAEYVLSSRAADGKAVESALQASVETLRSNFPGFTDEVRWTDRVLRFVQFLAKDYQFDDYRGVTLPKHELVYRMVTGDTNAPRFPMMAVRWRTPPQDIAALVTEANLTRFGAELYHFGDRPRPMSAELRLLSPGRYRVELLHDGRPVGPDLPPLEVKSSLTTVSFELPPQKLCALRITPAPAPGR